MEHAPTAQAQGWAICLPSAPPPLPVRITTRPRSRHIDDVSAAAALFSIIYIEFMHKSLGPNRRPHARAFINAIDARFGADDDDAASSARVAQWSDPNWSTAAKANNAPQTQRHTHTQIPEQPWIMHTSRVQFLWTIKCKKRHAKGYRCRELHWLLQSSPCGNTVRRESRKRIEDSQSVPR